MKNLIYGFIMDLSMFTIIPMPCSFWKEEGRRHMMKLYPISRSYSWINKLFCI